MAVEYNNGNDMMTVTCDLCGRVREYYRCYDFKDGIMKARADGWKLSRDSSGEWEHICSEC